MACACGSTPAELDQIRSVGPFDGWFRGAVIQCKYHGEWARTAALGPLLAEICDSLRPFDALVPVPLHRSRLRQRGFNQSLLLAREAAKSLHVPVEEVLVRIQRTDPQVHLSAAERRRNLMETMAVRPGSRIEGRTFVLIDDVVTTGSTLNACAAALKNGAALSIKAATVCREV